MAFQIEWKKSTKKDLRRLPSGVVNRIIKAVEALAENPFPQGVEKLSGSEHAYRIRLETIASYMKWSPGLSWSKFNACGIAKTSTGSENI